MHYLRHETKFYIAWSHDFIRLITSRFTSTEILDYISDERSSDYLRYTTPSGHRKQEKRYEPSVSTPQHSPSTQPRFHRSYSSHQSSFDTMIDGMVTITDSPKEKRSYQRECRKGVHLGDKLSARFIKVPDSI